MKPGHFELLLLHYCPHIFVLINELVDELGMLFIVVFQAENWAFVYDIAFDAEYDDDKRNNV